MITVNTTKIQRFKLFNYLCCLFGVTPKLALCSFTFEHSK